MSLKGSKYVQPIVFCSLLTWQYRKYCLNAKKNFWNSSKSRVRSAMD